MDAPRPPRVHVTPTSEDDLRRDKTDDENEHSEASPRRPARRPNPPDLEDALTRLSQTVERMAAIQNQPTPAEDPEFNWHALRSPLEATFPLPTTGVVQRIAAGLFAKVQAEILTGWDQHEARFVLDIISDWEDMDQELRTRVFQRLNIYTIVTTHGWPTTIAASAASTSNTLCFLPPGIQPVSRGVSHSNDSSSEEAEGPTTAKVQLRHQLLRLQPRLHAVAVTGAVDQVFKISCLT